MKAYRWEMFGYPIILKCNKLEAFRIIHHYGPEAKGATMRATGGEKYSYYGLNLGYKVLSPIRMLSLIVPGHEIPEIGPEVTLAFFLDDFQLMDMKEWLDQYSKMAL